MACRPLRAGPRAARRPPAAVAPLPWPSRLPMAQHPAAGPERDGLPAVRPVRSRAESPDEFAAGEDSPVDDDGRTPWTASSTATPARKPTGPALSSGRMPSGTAAGDAASCDTSAGRPSVGKESGPAGRGPAGRSRAPASHTGHGLSASDAARGNPHPAQAIVAMLISRETSFRRRTIAARSIGPTADPTRRA